MKLPDVNELIEIIEQDEYQGWCTNCGEWTHDSCEPDARNYECPECGQNTCFGAEEMLISMGAE